MLILCRTQTHTHTHTVNKEWDYLMYTNCCYIYALSHSVANKNQACQMHLHYSHGTVYFDIAMYKPGTVYFKDMALFYFDIAMFRLGTGYFDIAEYV